MSNLKALRGTMEEYASFQSRTTMTTPFRFLKPSKAPVRMVLMSLMIANYEWPVKLPANLPSCDRCTFAWSWINALGNRELYSTITYLTLSELC